MAAAFAARFRDELPALTADLPAAAVPAADTGPGWGAVAAAAVARVRADLAAGPRSRRCLVTLLVALLLLGLLVTAGLAAVHGIAGGGFEGHGGFDGR